MTKKKAFGQLISSELKVGNIVEWSLWNSKKAKWDLNYGVVIELKNEIRANRLVSISKVIPLKNPHIEMEFFTFSLRTISSVDGGTNTNDVKN